MAMHRSLAEEGAKLRPQSYTRVASLDTDGEHVYDSTFTRDGKYLIIGTGLHKSGTIRVWKVSDWTLVKTIHAHKSFVRTLAASPDGKRLVSYGFEGLLTIWDLQSGKPVRHLSGHTGQIFRLRYSPDGSLIAAADSDGSVLLWNSQTGKINKVLTGHQGVPKDVAFGPEGKFIISVSKENEPALICWKNVQPTSGWKIPQNKSIYGLAISPDGKNVATIDDGEVISIRQTVDGKLLKSRTTTKTMMEQVVYSPGGSRLFIASHNRIQIYDARSLMRLDSIKGDRHALQTVAVSPDGRTIAFGGIGKKVFVYAGH